MRRRRGRRRRGRRRRRRRTRYTKFVLATHLTRSEEKHCCGCVMAMNTKVSFVQALSVKLCAGGGNEKHQKPATSSG